MSTKFKCRALTSLMFWFSVTIIVLLILVYLKFSNSFLRTYLEKDIYELTFSLLSGLISSFIFYYIVVHIPQKNKKKIIKNNFLKFYEIQKTNIIHYLLFAYGKTSVTSELVEYLLNPKAFKKYFQNKEEHSQGIYYEVLNNLNEEYIEKIIISLRIIEKRIAFLMQNFEIRDEKYIEFFTQLENEIVELKHTKNNYEDRKQLGKFIWCMFTGWSEVRCYSDTDIVEKMINSI